MCIHVTHVHISGIAESFLPDGVNRDSFHMQEQTYVFPYGKRHRIMQNVSRQHLTACPEMLL